jgi:hypothetical protein
VHKPNEKYCPKCNAVFICNADDILHCECNSIQLSEVAIKHISATYSNCLCKNCLAAINFKLLEGSNFSIAQSIAQ